MTAVERVSARAHTLRPAMVGAGLLAVVMFPFIAIGWIAAKIFLAAMFVVAAIAEGWVAGTPTREAPPG